MTVAHLPTSPVHGLAPCAGLWALFDSTRTIDHWRARSICQSCPLLDGCKPPDKIVTPPFPGAMGRPSEGAAAIVTGTWGGRLFRKGKVAQVPPPPRDVACSLCGARQDQRCTTPGGNSCANHSVRIGPVMCPCGRVEAPPRRQYCEPCRIRARSASYANREERNPTRSRRTRRAKGAK